MMFFRIQEFNFLLNHMPNMLPVIKEIFIDYKCLRKWSAAVLKLELLWFSFRENFTFVLIVVWHSAKFWRCLWKVFNLFRDLVHALQRLVLKTEEKVVVMKERFNSNTWMFLLFWNRTRKILSFCHILQEERLAVVLLYAFYLILTFLLYFFLWCVCIFWEQSWGLRLYCSFILP